MLASTRLGRHFEHALLQLVARLRQLALHLLRGLAQLVGGGGEAARRFGDGLRHVVDQAAGRRAELLAGAVRRLAHALLERKPRGLHAFHRALAFGDRGKPHRLELADGVARRFLGAARRALRSAPRRASRRRTAPRQARRRSRSPPPR